MNHMGGIGMNRESSQKRYDRRASFAGAGGEIFHAPARVWLGLLLVCALLLPSKAPGSSGKPWAEEALQEGSRLSSPAAPLLAGRVRATTKAKLKTPESAARQAPPAPPKKTGGESEAAKRGREAHQQWDPGEGYEKEKRLPSGKRADAVNYQTQDVKELKPNNPRAIKRGEKQVEGYRRELEKEKGGSWTGDVETYEP